MNDLVAAKVEQARALLSEFDLDAWIVQFARETFDHPEPVQELAVGASVTWPAAFIVSPRGSTAIVGTGDVANVRQVGVYDDVIGYVKDIGPPLREALARADPQRIGLSYSVNDDHADNVTHGMYLLLQDSLRGTPFERRVTSAEGLLSALRARKLPAEVERIREAINTTLNIFQHIERSLQPGVTERQVADSVHRLMDEMQVTPAWDREYDPIVNFGPESRVGHAAPGDIPLQPGMLVHVDLGVKQEGYCSDLQRLWYVRRDGEQDAPEDVRRAFETVAAALQAGFDALRPGVHGWEADARARQVITEVGYEEPSFALGHQLGQTTHDGGGLLGPRWPRYGDRPDRAVEAGNVFTLEFGLSTSAGLVALEDDVLVTESGAGYLSRPQSKLALL